MILILNPWGGGMAGLKRDETAGVRIWGHFPALPYRNPSVYAGLTRGFRNGLNVLETALRALG